MKKYLILFAAAVVALASCGKELIEPENGVGEATPISFDLSANHPDMTKAVKSGWEAGDAIFVFFDNVEAPKHLKMTFDGTVWSSAEYNGATATPGALGLKNCDTGKMRAVFLPFGSDATVSANGTSFVFDKTYYTYYLTATRDYTVTGNKVSGAFDMVIPDGYVQFFVEDDAAVDETYSLGCDAVIPVGVASIGANGIITETSDKTYVDDMPGYAYSNGYLFSGKLTTWKYGHYYFAKTKSDNTRADYFVTGKTLASHDAVKLPASSDVYAINGDGVPNKGKWIPVGSGITVKLGNVVGEGNSQQFADFGTWYTCNYNCTKPEEVGTLYTFDDANAIEGITLPTKVQFEVINNSSNCSNTWLTVHGQQGAVVRANYGFLFLPAQNTAYGYYWSSTESENDSDYAWCFYFVDSGGHRMNYISRTSKVAVRPYQN